MIIPFLSEHSISRMIEKNLYITMVDYNDDNACDKEDKHTGGTGTCKFSTVVEIKFCNNFEIFLNKKKVLLQQTDNQLRTNCEQAVTSCFKRIFQTHEKTGNTIWIIICIILIIK